MRPNTMRPISYTARLIFGLHLGLSACTSGGSGADGDIGSITDDDTDGTIMPGDGDDDGDTDDEDTDAEDTDDTGADDTDDTGADDTGDGGDTGDTDDGCDEVEEGDDPPELLDCDVFSSDLTLIDHSERTIDYRIDCTPTVGGELVIEPGVVVEFASGTGLRVTGTNSRLDVQGETCFPVTLRGADGTVGEWRGVFIDNDSSEGEPANIIAHAEILHAGSREFNSNGDKGSIIVWTGNALTLTDTRIAESGAVGLNLHYSDSDITFARNRFDNNTDAAVLARPEYLDAMDEETTFEGNGGDYVAVENGDVQEPAQWAAMTAPYHILDGALIRINDGLTVDAGAQLTFESGAGLAIYGDRPLHLAGTEDAPITLEGADDARGHWRGIFLDNDSGDAVADNIIEHTTIRHAGGGPFNSNGDLGAIILWANNDLLLRSVTISDSGDVGFNGKYTGSTVSLEGENVFTDNAGPPMLLEPTLASIARSGDTYSGNDADYLLIIEGDVEGTHTWQALDVPYRFTSQTGIFYNVEFNAGSDVTIAAGAELTFEERTGLLARGDFIAAGTSSDPIIFRGTDATAGHWKGLFFIDPDRTSKVFTVQHAQIRDAGGGAFNSNGDLGAIIPWADTSISVTDTAFSSIDADCAINNRYQREGDTYTTTNSSTDGSAALICDGD